jgi:hypothetical protein
LTERDGMEPTVRLRGHQRRATIRARHQIDRMFLDPMFLGS